MPIKQMPIYRYKATSESGSLVQESREAPSKEDLAIYMAQQGLTATSIQYDWGRNILPSQKRVATSDLILANQELIALFRAGSNITEALDIVSEQPEPTILSSIFGDILHDIENGASASEAFSRKQASIDPSFISAITMGEQSGNLIYALETYQQQAARTEELKNSVKQAMIYPAVLSIVLMFALVFLFVFVVPRFTTMYEGLNTPLPTITKVLIFFVDYMPYILFSFFSCNAAVLISLKLYKQTTKGLTNIGRLSLSLPVLGSINTLFSIAVITRTISTLLKSGMPLVSAISTSQTSIENQYLKEKLKAVELAVTEGKSFSQALTEDGFLPSRSIKMISVGEKSGALETMLDEIAKLYDQLVEGKLKKFSAIIEPLLMLIIGLVIGGVIVAIYLPIFSIGDVIAS